MLLSVGVATVSVVALTIYFLIALPGVKKLWLSLIARSRRERVALLTDEVFDRVGGFMLGNLLTSVISAVGTYIWLVIFGVPYALLLALVVAVFDLIPMVGSTIAGIIVSLVALTKGLPVGIATAAFYITYRFLEDYLLNPRVMKHTVKVSPGLTIIATLIGGSLLGIIGALSPSPSPPRSTSCWKRSPSRGRTSDDRRMPTRPRRRHPGGRAGRLCSTSTGRWSTPTTSTRWPGPGHSRTPASGRPCTPSIVWSGWVGTCCSPSCLGHDCPAAEKARTPRYRELIGEARVFPGARDLVAAVHGAGLTTALATSSPADEVDQLLRSPRRRRPPGCRDDGRRRGDVQAGPGSVRDVDENGRARPRPHDRCRRQRLGRGGGSCRRCRLPRTRVGRVQPARAHRGRGDARLPGRARGRPAAVHHAAGAADVGMSRPPEPGSPILVSSHT